MALNPSGPISIEDINLELGRVANAAFDMNGVDERALVKVPTGPYSWNDWWGKGLLWTDSFIVTDNPNDYSTSAGDYFGNILAVSNSYIAIGVPNEKEDSNPSGTDLSFSGRVYIHSATTGAWIRTIDNPNPRATAENDSFGRSIAVTDVYTVVGSKEDSSSTAFGGVVYVFNTVTGALLQTLEDPDAGTGGGNADFGVRVSVSGTNVIVGARWEDSATSAAKSGVVYIFEATTGGLTRTIVNPNLYSTEVNDEFGTYADIDGTNLVVGVPNEDDSGIGEGDSGGSGLGSGKAYIINSSTGATLHTLDNPNDFGTTEGDAFGGGVAISGNYCAVNAPSEDDATTTNFVGRIYVYSVTTGSLLHTISNPNIYNTVQWDSFKLLDISNEFIMAGARGEDNASFARTGVVYLFDTVTGDLTHTFTNPNDYGTEQDDYFGTAGVINASRLVVGAPDEDDAGGLNSGKFYLKLKG